jgi:hypothetical protein
MESQIMKDFTLLSVSFDDIDELISLQLFPSCMCRPEDIFYVEEEKAAGAALFKPKGL